MRIIDCYNWKWKDIKSKAHHFKDLGFTAVKFSPILRCKEGMEHWKLYQNLDFTIGNRLGSEQELFDAADYIRSIGLETIVDIQLRHVAGRDNGEPVPHEDVPDSIKRFFIDKRYLLNDKNRRDVTEGGWGLPRIDYDNPELQNQEYWPLLDKVFEHFDWVRLDEGKHLGLPSEGYNLINNLYKRYDNKFIFECINEREDILNQYAQYGLVLTDTWSKMGRGSVRFFESHDSYYHGWGESHKWDDNRRIDELEKLMKKYHNVLLFLRPFDTIIDNPRLKEVLHKGEIIC